MSQHLNRAVLGWDLLARDVVPPLGRQALGSLLQEVAAEVVHADVAPVVAQRCHLCWGPTARSLLGAAHDAAPVMISVHMGVLQRAWLG